MKNHPRLLVITASLLSLILTASGCGKKDSDKIAEAQACLDTTESANALDCMSKVEGVNSEAADLIRCSANFIYQEFTDPDRLVMISEQMKDTDGSASAAIGLLAFAKDFGSTTAAQLMDQTSAYCIASKSKGMILLSQMAMVGTALATLAGSDVVNMCNTSSPSYSATDCQQAVQDQVCDADPVVLGNAAQTAYQQSCLGSSQVDSSVCQQFAEVTAGVTDPAVIGANLQTQLNNDTNCPP